MADRTSYRTGLHPLVHRPGTPQFSRHFRVSSVQPKAEVNWHKAVPGNDWSDLLNRNNSTCAPAGVLHQIQI